MLRGIKQKMGRGEISKGLSLLCNNLSQFKANPITLHGSCHRMYVPRQAGKMNNLRLPQHIPSIAKVSSVQLSGSPSGSLLSPNFPTPGEEERKEKRKKPENYIPVNGYRQANRIFILIRPSYVTLQTNLGQLQIYEAMNKNVDINLLE